MFLKTFQYRVQPTKAKEYLALRRRADAAYERLGHSLPAYLHSSSDPHRWLEIYTYTSEQEYRDRVAQLRQDLEIRRLWPRFQALLDPRFPSQVHEYHHEGAPGAAPPAWTTAAAASAAAAPVMAPPPVEPTASEQEEQPSPETPAGTPPERERQRENEDIEEANDADADTFSADDLPAADDDLEPEPPASETDAELTETEPAWPSDLDLAADEDESPLLLADERGEEPHDAADAETYSADDLSLVDDHQDTEVESHAEVNLYDEPALPSEDSAELNVYEPPTADSEQLLPEPEVEGDAAQRHEDLSALESAPSQEPPGPDAPVAQEERNGHAPEFNYYFDDPMAILEDANPHDYSPAPPADSVPLLEELPSENAPGAASAPPSAEAPLEATLDREAASAKEPPVDSSSLSEDGSPAAEPLSALNAPESEGVAAEDPPAEEAKRPLLPMVLPEDQQPLAEQPEEPYLNGAHYSLEDHADSDLPGSAESDEDSGHAHDEEASLGFDHDLPLEHYDEPNGRHDYGQQYPPR